MSSCQDWLACAARCASGLLAANFRNASDPPASCQNWLRPGTEVVKNAMAEFTSIVNLLRLECVTLRLYKIGRLNCSGHSKREMAATSGDDTGERGKHAGKPSVATPSVAKPSVAKPSVATRNIAMRGNRIDSRDLFSAEREIVIAHGEESYRLRLTSQNKLILTK